MENKNWEVVTNHTCLLGEGPVWDEVNNRIFWLDIIKGEIHWFCFIENEHGMMKVGQAVGAVALLGQEGLIAALQHGFAKIDIGRKTVKMIADPEAHLPNNRFNDGKCDPHGRFWAGTMDDIEGTEGAGSLYVLDRDMSVSRKIKDVTCSNGLAWSSDGQKFYFIDTPTKQVVSYDFDTKSANIDNKKVIISIPEESGYPDGMTIDAEGMLWIAHWDGWKVSRWDPTKGKLLETFSLPVSRITSCTFGGQDLNELYITSAKVGLSDLEQKEQPLAGSLFVIRNLGVKGILPNKFYGNH